MSRRLFIVTLACLAADPLVASNGAGEEYLWSIVKAGEYVIFIRHALTDQGVGDPPGFNLKNCDTQRNRYRATDEHQFDKKNPQVIQSPGVCSWRKRSPYNYVSHVDSNTNKTLNVSITYGSKSMKRTSPSRIERIPSAQLVEKAIPVRFWSPSQSKCSNLRDLEGSGLSKSAKVTTRA